jgi:RimJ/RimL family protein N-acetyltransferase
MPTTPPMQRLVTARCTLEPQVEAHAAAMFVVLSDPAIYAFENAPPPSLDWLQTRFRRLETRQSPDGRQRWLNWVIRLPSGDLAGYVQATVLASGIALVAYELSSAHWRQGLGSCAVSAMLAELASAHGVTLALAVLKARNFRSLGLLEHLGFRPANPDGCAAAGPEADEIVMAKTLAPATSAA